VSGLRQLEIADPRWSAFVTGQRPATAFHEPTWAGLLAECYGFRPFALVLAESNGVRAGLPVMEISRPLSKSVRWVSLPFTDACAPLAESPGTGAELLSQLDVARREAGVQRLELRAQLPVSGASVVGEAVATSLELEPDEDAVLRRLHPSQRRNIRRAEREGVVVRRAEKRQDLDRVFFDLQLETRHRLGVPVQPRRFFTLLWKHMLETGRGFLLLAYLGATPIAGTVILEGHGHLTYKFGASRRSHWRLRANSLLLWRAIQHGCASGGTSFDLGRTEARHDSLLAFKRQWSTSEEPLRYTVLGRRETSTRGGLASAAEPVVKHSPAWVCRVLGDVFYRYMA
jgi:CelD/BcsL family acetyltransferase involved in cellulose biosynthesis